VQPFAIDPHKYVSYFLKKKTTTCIIPLLITLKEKGIGSSVGGRETYAKTSLKMQISNAEGGFHSTFINKKDTLDLIVSA